MPRGIKHTVDLNKIHKLNESGYSLPEISEMYSVPRTTLNRYLKHSGYAVYDNRYRQSVSIHRRRKKGYSAKDFRNSENWKNALVQIYGYRCQVCCYDKIVDAHHIIPRSQGGKSTLDNGVLLCPNCHAESHAGLLDIMGLLKSGELLGPLEEGNQQPSRTPKLYIRGAKGSTTRGRAKAVIPPRAPDAKHIFSEDIVCTADITKQTAEARIKSLAIT